jgi:hypothetical protein
MMDDSQTKDLKTVVVSPSPFSSRRGVVTGSVYNEEEKIPSFGYIIVGEQSYSQKTILLVAMFLI